MENKYQIALDILRAYQLSSPFSNDSVQPSLDDIRKCDSYANKEHNRLLDTLQELIDKTTICGLSLDEAIPVIEMYRQLKHTIRQHSPIQDLMMGTKGQYYYDGKHSISQLEKALDIICECLEWEDNPPKPYSTWKEWVLNEVQDGK